MNKKFRFTKLDTVGTADAESDLQLINCFVDNGYVRIIQDCHDVRNIILGRTGSGKSALLKFIVEKSDHTIQINPQNLSLEFLTSSTILSSLSDLGVRFDLFFKMLWRHVLCVEIIKYCHDIKDQKNTDIWISSFLKRNDRRNNREAIKYLKEYGDKFWEESDIRIRQITENLELDVKTEVGCKIAAIKSGAKLSEEETAEIVYKAQNIVNKIQMSKLNKIFDLIGDVFPNTYKNLYITIDNLDEDWIENKFRYRMIRALVETARDFNRFDNIKLLIAIREDLFNRVLVKTRDPGYQKEKIESQILRIIWSMKDLENLIHKRIQNLINKNGGYSKISSEEVLPKSMSKREDTLSYVFDRTLKRPRDVIVFINCILHRCDGRSQISAQIIREAEIEYSESRFTALADEWFTDFPYLTILSKILFGKKDHFLLNDIDKNEFDNYCLSVLTDQKNMAYEIGKIYNLTDEYINSSLKKYDYYRNEIILIFFKIGLIGLRLYKSQSTKYFIDERSDLRANDFNGDTKIFIHKAFWRYLNIIPVD